MMTKLGQHTGYAIFFLRAFTFVLTAACSAQAACPSFQGRFVPSGSDVTDSLTGLVWQRCSVGQTWDGKICSGVAKSYQHEQAFIYAKNQGVWRLPNVKELGSLVDYGCSNPAIDHTVFVNTAPGIYWTSTPSSTAVIYPVPVPVDRQAHNAYYVNFDTGGIDSRYSRSNYYYIRLVRAP